MIIDEIKESLKNAEPNLEIINSYLQNYNIADQFKKLEEESKGESFRKNPNQVLILKELQRLKVLIEEHDRLINTYNDLKELVTLFESDENELIKLKDEVSELCRTISKFKINMLLNKPEDNENCFFSINAGAGGTESQDWADMLLRMYVRFCEREKLNVQVIDYQSGEEAGIKSATLYIKGKKAFGLLKNEHGVHRLVRISPFDSAKRRHTSFAAIHVTPEVSEAEIKIETKDLRIDTYRASGAGGQHVNKTESAVRITHLPTNIVVQCQSERSQTQNRETAMKMLMAKLVERQKEEQESQLAKIEKKKIEWGSQIRSYILHPYKMVKDHRTDYESPQPDLVLDGQLMDFIEAYLIKSS